MGPNVYAVNAVGCRPGGQTTAGVLVNAWLGIVIPCSHTKSTHTKPTRPAGFKVKTGRKTWAFEVRQLDKHADLWVKEIQQSINR